MHRHSELHDQVSLCLLSSDTIKKKDLALMKNRKNKKNENKKNKKNKKKKDKKKDALFLS